MSLCNGNGSVVRKSILPFAWIAISAFVWGQHKPQPKAPAPNVSKPVRPSNPSNPSVARAPIHAPSPNPVSRPTAPPPARNPRGNGATAAGRPENTPGNRRPDPVVVDHIGDISEYRRGPAHTTPTSAEASHSPVSLRNGVLTSASSSQVRTVNRDGMQIQRNPRGERMIVSERNGTRIVSTGAGRGYVQHPYLTRGGRSYYSRTYLDHGAYRVGIYRGYNYGGRQYYGYYPGYWYHPAFYNWAYRPWDAPVYWNVGMGGWGWAGARWYGYYGGYFVPYPVYSSAAFWLTDYLIAADLQAAYAARSEANGDEAGGYDPGQANSAEEASRAANSATLTPEVKQAIAEEVKAELAAEQQQSSATQSSGSSDRQAQDRQAHAPAPANDELPSALDPARRTFVVSSAITVTSNGQECELTPGDILTRPTTAPDADQNVTVIVSATKKKDCALGKPVVVSLDTLQEMRNHFDEQLDSGIKMLAEKQGTGGLPKAPDTAQTASDVPTPAPDATAAKDLNDQEAAADRAEMQLNQETGEAQGTGQFSAQSGQGTSLGDIARRARAQKQQAQADSDAQSKPTTVPDEAASHN